MSITGWGIDLNYRDIEWFTLETNRDHSVIFETASKYCILDSFVDHDGYSMKLSHALWGHPRWAGMVERSDIMWSTGERNGKSLQYSCLENPNMKRQNDRILKEELPRSVGVQYASGDQWRNNSRKKEGMEPKQKQYPAVDVTDRSKV